MAVISGYHVDDYCVPVFRQVVKALRDRLGAEKITDLLEVRPGDLIARVPPKIGGADAPDQPRPVPVFRIRTVGQDFDESGNLVLTSGADYLYFEADQCLLLSFSAGEPYVGPSDDVSEGAVDCFNAQDVGRVEEKHQGLDEDLKGILYRIPPDRLLGLDAPVGVNRPLTPPSVG